VSELLEEKQERTKITAEWIVAEYLENMKMAKEQGDTKSINTALKNLAELVGANEAKKLDIKQDVNINDIKQEMDALKNEFFSS
jgi:hypothetical protein